LSRPSVDYATTTNFYVFTTTGYLARVDGNNVAFNTWSSQTMPVNMHTNTLYTTNINTATTTHSGLDCETHSGVTNCLNKGDHFMVLNSGYNWLVGGTDQYLPGAGAVTGSLPTWEQHDANPIYPQIYQVKKISRQPVPESVYTNAGGTVDGIVPFTTALTAAFVRDQIVADKNFNTNFYLSTITANAALDTSATVYKFYPPTNAYTFAGPCSNRGICDHDAGVCGCFSGFTGDNCGTIDALAQ